MSKLLQNSGTRLPQLMNTSGFHQNVGEGNKSFNAMSPDPLLCEAFGKWSGCARLTIYRVPLLLLHSYNVCRLLYICWLILNYPAIGRSAVVMVVLFSQKYNQALLGDQFLLTFTCG